jgi:homoserine dehydrogenase
VRVVLLGYGNVGKAFARLLKEKRSAYPFPIAGIHTANHETAFHFKGLDVEPEFGPKVSSADEFLERAKPDVAIEITSLNAATGEPAISHIRSALLRKVHVITANKGPIAHAYGELCQEARRSQVEFRFESTVMDGAPVFNMGAQQSPSIPASARPPMGCSATWWILRNRFEASAQQRCHFVEIGGFAELGAL